jgi:hypothetical protein
MKLLILYLISQIIMKGEIIPEKNFYYAGEPISLV